MNVPSVQPAGPPSESGRIAWPISLGAIFIAGLTGPFGSHDLPLLTRLLLWGSLIGWNVAKWQLWFRFVMAREESRRDFSVRLGLAVLGLNALLPWEVESAYAAVGRPVDLPALAIWLIAVLIALTIAGVIAAVEPALSRHRVQPISTEPAEAPVLAHTPRPLPGWLARAGVGKADCLIALRAEDHYLRLFLDNAGDRLIAGRFGDAVTDLAGLDGSQIHRSYWVAHHALQGLERHGRTWRVHLSNGLTVPVGSRHLARIKAMGLPRIRSTVVTRGPAD